MDQEKADDLENMLCDFEYNIAAALLKSAGLQGALYIIHMITAGEAQVSLEQGDLVHGTLFNHFATKLLDLHDVVARDFEEHDCSHNI